MDKLNNVHPGEILLEDFIKPMGLSQNKLANAIGVPPRRINEIVLGKRSVTPDTALRLAKYFGTSSSLWVGLQSGYDIENEEQNIHSDLASIVPYIETNNLNLH